MERSELKRQIFLTCKSFVENVDDDQVKEIRDDISYKLFHKTTSELTDSELEDLLYHLRYGEKRCTKKQEYAVRGHAFEFAIHYHNYENFREFNKLGVRKSAADVKLMIQEEFKQNGYRAIKPKHKEALVKETANPKCKELLVEGGFRKTIGKPDSFYYDKMTLKEASYLISRFGQILNKAKILKPIGFEKQISDN